jgi:molecular chaperone DnaK (HSP70)
VLAIGIDLGTTNSVVASVRGGKADVLADENGDRLTPSVVNFHPNGHVIVGAAARNRRRVDPRNTLVSTKRLLGYPFESPIIQELRARVAYNIVQGDNNATQVEVRGERYTLPEISAFILRRLRDIATRATGAPIQRAVITVPAHFNELQRAATKVSGRIAGLEVLRVINEPTAAALAYGLGRSKRERVVVYDFGGGTFDCTVLDLNGSVYEVLATCGDSYLGGDDIDTELALRMRQKLLQESNIDALESPETFDRLRHASEELKVQLTHSEHARVVVQELGVGKGGRPVHLDVELTRTAFDDLTRPFIDRTLLRTQEALALAEVAPSSIDRVILVGGSTRSPIVANRVAQFFQQMPLSTLNVDEVVALGAAYQAAALSDFSKRTSIPEPPPIFDPNRPQSSPPGLYIDSNRSTRMIARARVSSVVDPFIPDETPEVLSHALVSSMPPPMQPIGMLAAPVLVDVTPRALVVETAGGFCDVLIPRNARVPCGRVRQFSLGMDNQTTVTIRVGQGESVKFGENTYLGEVKLSGLRAAPRGEVVVSVSFELDEGGLLRVRARDAATTVEAQATLQLVGLAGEGTIEVMRARIEGASLTGRASLPPVQ